jgi:hypothetical protein
MKSKYKKDRVTTAIYRTTRDNLKLLAAQQKSSMVALLDKLVLQALDVEKAKDNK